MVTMIQDKIKEIQLKHLVQLAVCVLAVYLLRVRNTYQLVPSWRKDLDSKHYRNGRFPSEDEKLPGPIFTDLNGDGIVEAVFVTSTFYVEICKIPKLVDLVGNSLPHAVVKHSKLLPRAIGTDGVAGRPVVMETGYLDQYSSVNQQRTQVLLVLYSNWYVVCYDHELTVLWEQTVLDTSLILKDYLVQSMSILVTPQSIQRGDRGLVIVGGSYKHKHHKHSDVEVSEGTGRDDESPDLNQDSYFTRFSTFALSGNNGTTRWYHFPSTQDHKVSSEAPAHHWKLSLRRGHWPHGKVHWSRFGTYLLKHTPHKWHGIKDTKFDLANMRKLALEESHPPQVDPSPMVDLDLDTKHIIGEPFGGLRPHSHHEHISNPNALVIHHHEGLEVLSLQSGQLITDLRLDNPTAVYVDLNQDGDLDQVRISVAGACQGEGSTIHPRPKAIFADDICQTVSWWAGIEAETTDDDIKVAPIVIKSVTKPRGFLNHLLGKALPTERKGYDSVFVTSQGVLTSFNQHGHKNWKTRIPVKWSDKFRALQQLKCQRTENGNQFYDCFRPSMVPFALKTYGPESSAVVSGWETIVLIHLGDGYMEAQHSLPCQPLDNPLISDFNQDGWNDIVVTCPSGYVGFSVQSQPQYVYMIALSVAIILTMLLLSWCCQIDNEDVEQYDDS